MNRVAIVVVAACVLPCACGSSSDSPVAGFTLTRATTKCRLGDDVTYSVGAWDQWTGSEGLFKIDPENQLAICEATWPAGAEGPSAAVEISDVRAYFVGAGMPEEQIGASSVSYSADSSGASFPNARFTRTVDGTPVAESFAWAGMIDGQSLGESVFWPALPATVSVELAQLQAIVGDPSKLSAFQAKLPAGVVTGSVVIHHTSQFANEPLEAHACYDALAAEGAALGPSIARERVVRGSGSDARRGGARGGVRGAAAVLVGIRWRQGWMEGCRGGWGCAGAAEGWADDEHGPVGRAVLPSSRATCGVRSPPHGGLSPEVSCPGIHPGDPMMRPARGRT